MYLVVIHNIEQVLLKTSFSATIIVHGPIEVCLCGFGCHSNKHVLILFPPKHIQFFIQTFYIFYYLTFVRELCNQLIPLSCRSPLHISKYNVIMTLQCYNKSSFKHPLSNKPFAPLLPLLLFFTMRCINVTLYFTTVTVHAG